MPGYEYCFVDKLNRRVVCPICQLPMRDPVQITSCRHRFCDTCLQEFLSEGVFKCPEDQSPLDYAKIYPEPEVRVEVMTSLVRCTHFKDGCRWVDKLQNMQAHLEMCRHNNVKCPNDCSTLLSRMSLDDHLQYSCPKRSILCEFCAKTFSGDAMENHEGNCPMEIVWCENKCGARLQRRYLSNHMRNECHKRTLPCPYCTKEFLYETLQSHYYQCPRFPISCPNRCDPNKIPREDVENHLMEVCPSATIACTFNRVGCKHLCPRFALERHLTEESGHHLNLMGQLIQTQEQQIKDMTLTLHNSGQVTNGCFLWKISNFKGKLSDARSNGLELQSTPFYTSCYGYKLCVSLFPNGNGSGEGTHMSLYISMQPGEYDNLVEWPFRLPISFKLLDQGSEVDKRVNVVESFVPNSSWKHFQKPSANSDGMGFGYPKFVSQETVKNGSYIKDDAIFVKIAVDVSQFIDP